MDAPTVIAASSGSGFLFIIIIAFLLLYLIVVRPQRRRQNQQQRMISDLEVGDEVLTAGGIYGTVSSIDEDEVTVEIAPKLEVRVARRAIAGVAREPEPEESEGPEGAEEEHEGAAASHASETDSNGVIPGPETSVDENPG